MESAEDRVILFTLSHETKQYQLTLKMYLLQYFLPIRIVPPK